MNLILLLIAIMFVVACLWEEFKKLSEKQVNVLKSIGLIIVILIGISFIKAVINYEPDTDNKRDNDIPNISLKEAIKEIELIQEIEHEYGKSLESQRP